MLTLRDVIDYSNLTEREIDAIAAHEHVPKIIAAEMACQLDQLLPWCKTPDLGPQ